MFKDYPNIQYGDSKTTMVDITRRISVLNEIKNTTTLFQEYIIKDGQQAIDIAYNFYGNSNYHFVILLLNDIQDPFYGWVLSVDEFEDFVNDKYGEDNINGVHHWENSDGNIVSSDTNGAISVTNYVYEMEINEAKRRIKILKPEYISDFIVEYKNVINGN